MNNAMTGHKRTATIVAIMAALSAAFWLYQQKPQAQRPQARDFVSKVPVSVAPASKGMVRDSFAIVGVSDAYRDVDILSETSGIVRAVSSEVGQKKASGETLLKVDDEVAASGLRKARVNREMAMRDFERYRNLEREGAVPITSYEAMKLKLEDADADLVSAQRRYRDTAIKAPVSGTVTSRLVEVGALVQPGMKVANMVDLSRVRIKTSVPEKQVPLLTEGMPVQVTTDLYPGRVFKASIASISAKSSRDHTYLVESLMDNPKEAPFRAGMFVRTAFVRGEVRHSLLIPRQALVGSIRNAEVFVVNRGIARRSRLAVGAEPGNRIEVLQGLNEGDLVVVSGQNELDDGMPVTVVRQEGGR
jgi:RND family efflux transporter MFP subunit